ncbi:MAG: formylglycine-generating enzyme family protein [Chitinophagaceae bacterium]
MTAKHVFLSVAHFILAIIVANAQTTPGQVFKDCSRCPEMVVIPGGSFMMGSPENEPGRDSMEGPQHKVTVAAFAMGKFHITRGQWNYFVMVTNRPAGNGCAWSGLPGEKPWAMNPAASWEHLGFPQDDTHPAVCLSWKDVNDYVKWLSISTGYKYRLPTEAEWEYAARAGSVTAYPWGDTASHELMNYGADSGWTGIAAGKDQWVGTSPVGSFPANAFGLYDMPGNVMQFTADCLSTSYQGVPANGTAFQKDSCTSRIIRGGDWGDPPGMLRSAFRNYAPAPGSTLDDYRSAGLGLRVVRILSK